MPGPSRRSEAAEFLRRKRERQRAEATGKAAAAEVVTSAPPASHQQLRQDYSASLRHLRALLCDERPMGQRNAVLADWRRRLRWLLRSMG